MKDNTVFVIWMLLAMGGPLVLVGLGAFSDQPRDRVPPTASVPPDESTDADDVDTSGRFVRITDAGPGVVISDVNGQLVIECAPPPASTCATEGATQ